MNDIQKQKIDFYNACYYLCGLSGDAFLGWFHGKKTIKITDSLDACVYRCLNYLKPSDIYFANQHMPNLSLDDQKGVIKKSYEMIVKSLDLVYSKSRVTQKARKLVKKYN